MEVQTDRAHNETNDLRYPELYRLLYFVWAPLKRRLSNSAVDGLTNIRSAVRSLFFESEGQDPPELSLKDRRYLADLYAGSNARLQEWLGRDLSHWTGVEKKTNL